MIINCGYLCRVSVFNLTSTTIASSNSLNSLINKLEKGDLVEKDILVRNMVSSFEIDAKNGDLQI